MTAKKTELVTANRQASQEVVTLQNPTEERHMRMMESAFNNGADIATIEKLVYLQEKFEANQARKNFFSAMALFQSTIPSIESNGEVDYTTGKGRTNYSYVLIGDIAKAIKAPLFEAGLSYRFEQKFDNGFITLKCIVHHIDGHSESTLMTAQPDNSGGKDPIKAIASSITYLKRYTLIAALGIITSDPDLDSLSEQNEFLSNNQPDNTHPKTDYPAEQFNMMFPKWVKLINNGKQTKDSIISSLTSKGAALSEQQLTAIREI